MKNKKIILAAAIIILCIAAVIILVLTNNDAKPNKIIVEETEWDASADGISIADVQNIAGMYVEDGSDEVLTDIFSVDFENTNNKTLQYAKLIFTVNGEDYTFEISTIPSGACVRAMEMDRKPMPESFDTYELQVENIAWFNEEPGMHEDTISVVGQNGSLLVTNTTASDISAPIYVYYKNITAGTYIGGITYRVALKENLPAGETLTIPAKHFDKDMSELMFVEYAK